MSERTYYDGKYTVKARTDGGLEFLRYGEAWPAADALLRFNNLLGAMFREQLDADAEIAALKQRVAELEREQAGARKVAIGLHDFATAHEKWEAALIMDDAAWSGGMAAWPTLTETLYAGMMELQRQRNLALAAYRAAQIKEPRDEAK